MTGRPARSGGAGFAAVGMTRRQLVAQAIVVGLSLTAAGGVLAACGPDSAQIGGEPATNDGSPPP